MSKQVIFSEVWNDVVVSDGALAQAIRTLRRTLGDDVREPQFIRTVSRHGYQFVWPDVGEEPDDEPMSFAPANGIARPPPAIEPLVDRLMSASTVDDARDAAEQLHALGTAEAMSHVTARPHHAPAVAIMRDARWSVPDAGEVPLLRDAEAPHAILALIRLRLADVRQDATRRWAVATASGALGGMAAGLAGGAVLYLAPMSQARLQSAAALAALGAAAGGVGAAGVAAGLALAEALARSRRTLALIVSGGLGGAAVAVITGVLLRALLEGLFGLHLLHEAGAVDGLVLGVAAGIGYALTTSSVREGGLAAPRGWRRVRSVVVVSGCCALGAIALTLAGRSLVGGLVHEIARSSRDAELVLAPLGRLIGEPDFGPVTQVLLGAFEGASFGLALGWGMTIRPNRRADR